ncbi:hypothetical protein GGP41_005359 [Bipolaris sorokiniana]|uniref:Transposase IS30-like HTH domain-containing protein n=1 Tax=Cochliobolus sativus TaxID=45130 RepID=A0A8H6DVY3_COCSA|nr:hypothetical protein GGP41_005359 [Bipolaris sorokiniana]
MPTTNAAPHRFGQELSQNARLGPNITIEERNIAIDMLRGSCGVPEVAAHFHRACSTIRRLYQKYSTTATTQDKPRSGRSKIFSNYQKKIIWHKPKIEYKDLIKVATMTTRRYMETLVGSMPRRLAVYRASKGCQTK